MKRCPTCNSPAPHLYLAVQFEGEVEICTDAFHLTPTPQNTTEHMRDVIEKRRAKGDFWPEGIVLEIALNAKSN